MSKFKINPVPIKSEKLDRNALFPIPLRCLIVGSSGCGKTTLIWNIITEYWLPYQKLYIFSKSIDQLTYHKLRDIFEDIQEGDEERATFFDQCEDIVSVDDCEPNSLIIFDDCILEPQSPIKEYFVRGRHKNISCIYISQCFSLVDLKTIRNNLNFLCIFKQNECYTRSIYDNFVGSDMMLSDFRTLCHRSWQRDYGFLSIDLTRKMNEGRYKSMFDEPLHVSETL